LYSSYSNNAMMGTEKCIKFLKCFRELYTHYETGLPVHISSNTSQLPFVAAQIKCLDQAIWLVKSLLFCCRLS